MKCGVNFVSLAWLVQDCCELSNLQFSHKTQPLRTTTTLSLNIDVSTQFFLPPAVGSSPSSLRLNFQRSQIQPSPNTAILFLSAHLRHHRPLSERTSPIPASHKFVSHLQTRTNQRSKCAVQCGPSRTLSMRPRLALATCLRRRRTAISGTEHRGISSACRSRL